MSCIKQETKGPCAICSNSIPDIPGQKIIHYCNCKCAENPIICPNCRRDKEFWRKPKVCRWCHQRISNVLSCTRTNAFQIEFPTRQWVFVMRNFPKINRGFLNFGVFANFRINHTHFNNVQRFSQWFMLYKRDISHQHLKHFSVSLARILICNMFGELKTTNFFARKCTIVKKNNELMRMVFQRVLAVLESMLFMALENSKWL
jgi:hypothetical protein